MMNMGLQIFTASAFVGIMTSVMAIFPTPQDAARAIFPNYEVAAPETKTTRLTSLIGGLETLSEEDNAKAVDRCAIIVPQLRGDPLRICGEIIKRAAAATPISYAPREDAPGALRTPTSESELLVHASYLYCRERWAAVWVGREGAFDVSACILDTLQLANESVLN